MCPLSRCPKETSAGQWGGRILWGLEPSCRPQDLWNGAPKLPSTVPTPALGQNTTATMKEMMPEDEREEADTPHPPSKASGSGPVACSSSGQDRADESGDISSRLLSIHGSGALGTSSEQLLRIAQLCPQVRTVSLKTQDTLLFSQETVNNHLYCTDSNESMNSLIQTIILYKLLAARLGFLLEIQASLLWQRPGPHGSPTRPESPLPKGAH